MQVNGSVNTGYYAADPSGASAKNGSGITQTEGVKDYGKLLEEKRSELWTKIMNGDTEATYQIGGQSFTEKEWERLLKRVDTEIETEDEEEASEDKSSVEPFAALVAEITDKEQFLGEQQSKVEEIFSEEEEIQIPESTDPVVEEPTPEERLDAIVDEAIAAMPLEDKVAGRCIVTPEAITGVSTAIQAGEGTQTALAEHPVGGLIYFAKKP